MTLTRKNQAQADFRGLQVRAEEAQSLTCSAAIQALSSPAWPRAQRARLTGSGYTRRLWVGVIVQRADEEAEGMVGRNEGQQRTEPHELNPLVFLSNSLHTEEGRARVSGALMGSRTLGPSCCLAAVLSQPRDGGPGRGTQPTGPGQRPVSARLQEGPGDQELCWVRLHETDHMPPHLGSEHGHLFWVRIRPPGHSPPLFTSGIRA